MTLFIAYLMLYQWNYDWKWYVGAGILWACHVFVHERPSGNQCHVNVDELAEEIAEKIGHR